MFDAVAQIKRALAGRVPLIGFAGSPFTLACYMIEGSGSADFATVRRMAYARPDLLARIVDVNARAVTAYLDAQIDSGADAVMLFDTWGGLLTADAYRAFSLGADARDRRAAPARRPRVPTIVFTKGGGGWLARHRRDRRRMRGPRLDRGHRGRARRSRRRASRCRAISTRWCCSPIRRRLRAKRERIVRAAGPAPGHIFNLGHGIVPATPPEQRRGAGRGRASPPRAKSAPVLDLRGVARAPG